ncbi:hypothetical protein F2P81_013475 [Scophthalmus maximus]|uniref:Peptidase aspartic putative domain-containing protein n=1 Tax=Scophthalmus maximus TaxID=52904 RepID=A0A6A4SLC9_SCOMX|nr:hypothetical protein F2P81_013475 [Scophthalmus maximus]
MVSSLQECCHIGAGSDEYKLSIVPVQIKSNTSDKTIETYAFLDNGSTDTFCTEGLMEQLNINGKRTCILPRTMGQDKCVPSHIITGVEVSGLEKDKFIPLPKVFTLHSDQEGIQLVTDAFKFNIKIKEKPQTRRGMLSVVSSIYDPLGFLAPLTLAAKCLLQELCKQNHDWDQVIPKATSEKWLKWTSDLVKLADFKLERCI